MIQLQEFHVRGIDIPSSKNSQVWTGDFLVHSPATQKWKRKTKGRWAELAPFFLAEIERMKMLPVYYIEFTFLRRTRATFDHINMAQIVQDSMVKFNWVIDDDDKNMKPYFGDPIHDKHDPGVIIRILPEKPIHYDKNRFEYVQNPEVCYHRQEAIPNNKPGVRGINSPTTGGRQTRSGISIVD